MRYSGLPAPLPLNFFQLTSSLHGEVLWEVDQGIDVVDVLGAQIQALLQQGGRDSVQG